MELKPKATTAADAESALLDQFAAAAMPSVLAGDHSAKHDTVAEKCYRVADAMLAEKKKRTPPVVESLEPATAAIGDESFTLHVKGSGFRPDSVIYWNGSAEPTTFVSDSELTTGVNMATAQHAVSLPVMVMNGNTASAPQTFTLTEGAARKKGGSADDKSGDKGERGEQRAEAGRR